MDYEFEKLNQKTDDTWFPHLCLVVPFFGVDSSSKACGRHLEVHRVFQVAFCPHDLETFSFPLARFASWSLLGSILY